MPGHSVRLVMTGVAAGVGHDPSPAGKARVKAIEDAMSKAVTDAYAAGLVDPDEIRARMLSAREAVLHPVNTEADKS